MKLNNALLVSVTILLIALSACTTTSSNKVDWEREDVIGSWKISEASYKAIKRVKSKSKIVTLFELNLDSTAVFYYGEDHETKKEAKWHWQSEKKLAYDEFGVSLEHDIIIKSKKMGMGMLLENNDGKITLNARDFSFEKQ